MPEAQRLEPTLPTRPPMAHAVRFTIDDADHAAHAWRFNCGPSALCAVLDLTPDEIRPHLLDFEMKGYTNPTLMFAILRGLGVQYRLTYRGDLPQVGPLPSFGLVRVQWGGPWTRPGVPMVARYRQTHWVGCRRDACDDRLRHIFDINAMRVGGWLPFAEWSTQLVPCLIKECCPKGDGTWWPTHALRILTGPTALRAQLSQRDGGA